MVEDPGRRAQRGHALAQALQEFLQFGQIVDVGSRGVAPGYAGTENLNRLHPQPVARRDFRIRIVAHHQHFLRAQTMAREQFLEEAVFALPRLLVNRINLDVGKPVGEPWADGWNPVGILRRPSSCVPRHWLDTIPRHQLRCVRILLGHLGGGEERRVQSSRRLPG